MSFDRANSSLPRVNILGVGVSAIDMPRAVDMVTSAVSQGRKGYVCVTGVHGIMEAQKDAAFRTILNRSFLTTPDGMPTVWIGRLNSYTRMRRVYGPDFMLNVCSASVERGYTHFLYGGVEGVADQLKAELTRKFPGLKIVGTYTPPFRPLNAAEGADLQSRISQLRPDFFWVGLSTPKQERFMAEYLPKLDTRVMVGVGAAFDIHTGRAQDSPDWVKNAGLQWLHRLLQEPSRLWKRYLINNPAFIWKMTSQLLGITKYESL
jgi:N-acetylglucosaminyldiphosphoundecaprenol N-acetyl-beta-D-mannosaminyltransferase